MLNFFSPTEKLQLRKKKFSMRFGIAAKTFNWKLSYHIQIHRMAKTVIQHIFSLYLNSGEKKQHRKKKWFIQFELQSIWRTMKYTHSESIITARYISAREFFNYFFNYLHQPGIYCFSHSFPIFCCCCYVGK